MQVLRMADPQALLQDNTIQDEQQPGDDDFGGEGGFSDDFEPLEMPSPSTSHRPSLAPENIALIQPLYTATISGLQYAKTRRTFDMSHLKRAMWQQVESARSSKPVKLTQIISHLPQGIIEGENRVKLALGFMSLLHLANEKNLSLSSVEHSQDIAINV